MKEFQSNKNTLKRFINTTALEIDKYPHSGARAAIKLMQMPTFVIYFQSDVDWHNHCYIRNAINYGWVVAKCNYRSENLITKTNRKTQVRALCCQHSVLKSCARYWGGVAQERRVHCMSHDVKQTIEKTVNAVKCKQNISRAAWVRVSWNNEGSSIHRGKNLQKSKSNGSTDVKQTSVNKIFGRCKCDYERKQTEDW